MTLVDASPPAARTHLTEVLPFDALDGQRLTAVHVTDPARPPTLGPVLLVHGAGVRAEVFRPPLRRTLVDGLLEDGHDVWMLNWRASIDLERVAWTLDDAAAYDHPAAVRFVLQQTGAETLKAFVHCQGSTSFVMSAVAGLLPEVTTIVSNAVSLHPVIPPMARLKIRRLLPLLRPFTPSLSPRWGYKSDGLTSRVIRTAVRATHHECRNPVCGLVSFVYGSGHPALWSHRNLDSATHDWITGEFADVPLSFFTQMNECVRAGHLVSTGEVPGLPASFVESAPQTDARFVLIAGEDNRCFLPESQQRTFDFLERHHPGRNRLHRISGYGHLDVVFGARAWLDTHPIIREELLI